MQKPQQYFYRKITEKWSKHKNVYFIGMVFGFFFLFLYSIWFPLNDMKNSSVGLRRYTIAKLLCNFLIVWNSFVNCLDSCMHISPMNQMFMFSSASTVSNILTYQIKTQFLTDICYFLRKFRNESKLKKASCSRHIHNVLLWIYTFMLLL